MEALQTRTEYSRSLDDAERYRALDTLVELGQLIPLAEIETYHGRVALAADHRDWIVDPNFANGGNDSGNYNVNQRPTLYTGDRQIANDFANARMAPAVTRRYNQALEAKVGSLTPEQRQALQADADDKAIKWYRNLSTDAQILEQRLPADERQAITDSASEPFKVEVHNIISEDADAKIIDLNFNPNQLDEAARQQYVEALRVLLLPVTEGSPVSFDQQDATARLIKAIKARPQTNPLIFEKDVDELAEMSGNDKQVTMQLAGASNARILAQSSPNYLVYKLQSQSSDLIMEENNISGQEARYPLNLEYVGQFLRQAHIVGAKVGVSSATLDRDIQMVSFFDLDKVTTEKALVTKRTNMGRKLGGLAAAMGELPGTKPAVEQPALLRLLSDAHSKPEKLVEAAKQVEGYDKIFEADAGNWEGFTLAEHTETVLRNFDENYADEVPVEYLAPMRLAILVHDIGKPVAVAQRAKHLQKRYNVAQADDFLGKLGVDKKMKQLLLTVIGDGAELAFQVDIRHAGHAAESAMNRLADKAIQEFTGDNDVSDAQQQSFIEMCKILQVCDGGAYTSMAVTRAARGRGRYRNAPSFNRSFAQPLGIGKRKIKLREGDEFPAESDLTSRST